MANVLGHSILSMFGAKNTPRKTLEVLTQTEVDLFLAKAKELGNSWYPIWLMALHTGMRSSELMTLTWDDVCFDKEIIRVRNIKNSKSNSERFVPMSVSVKKLLEELKNTSSENFVLERPQGWKEKKESSILRAFLKSIGIKEIHFHLLRTTWATTMFIRGVPLYAIAQMGGWHSISTLNSYLRGLGALECNVKEYFNF